MSKDIYKVTAVLNNPSWLPINKTHKTFIIESKNKWNAINHVREKTKCADVYCERICQSKEIIKLDD